MTHIREFIRKPCSLGVLKTLGVSTEQPAYLMLDVNCSGSLSPSPSTGDLNSPSPKARRASIKPPVPPSPKPRRPSLSPKSAADAADAVGPYYISFSMPCALFAASVSPRTYPPKLNDPPRLS